MFECVVLFIVLLVCYCVLLQCVSYVFMVEFDLKFGFTVCVLMYQVAAWCGDAAMIKLLLSAGAILDGGGNGGPLGTLLSHFGNKILIFF